MPTVKEKETANKVAYELKYISKAGKCDVCKIDDSHTKIICQYCKNGKHIKCIEGKLESNLVFSGQWNCARCKRINNDTPPIKQKSTIAQASTSYHRAENYEIPIEQLLEETATNNNIRGRNFIFPATGVITRQTARKARENFGTKSVDDFQQLSISQLHTIHNQLRTNKSSHAPSRNNCNREIVKVMTEEMQIRQKRHESEEEADRRRIERLREHFTV